MIRVEEKIREYLAKNLSMISDNLTLIKQEYALKNKYGASGFIDILASDLDNNYTVIEIKRSNQAARQALNEICKYCALLKQNLHIRDSEIRIIIVSSEWDELLIPFSEFYNYMDVYIEGYKINLDEKNIPISCELISPISININYQRKFSTEHLVFLYNKNDDLNKIILEIKNLMPRLGLNDYVILKMNTTDKIAFPFCIYVVFQRYTEYYYLNVLQNLEKEENGEDSIYNEVLEEKEIYEDDEEGYICSLEESICCYITNKIKCDSLEISYPEKFQRMLQLNWQINEVFKGGCFENDLRLSKDIIIREILGYDGSNEMLYVNQTHSKHKSKIEEIKNNATNCLGFNKTWNDHISTIFNNICNENKEFRIAINIFNTDNIIEVIAGITYSKQLSYLPCYDFVIDYTAESKLMIYHGSVIWNGVKRNFNDLIKNFFNNDPFNYFINRQFGMLAEMDASIMEYLGLKYKTSLFILIDDEIQIKDVDFNNGKIEITEPKNEKDFFQFLEENELFAKNVVQFINTNSSGLL